MSQETLQSFVGVPEDLEAPKGNGPWKVKLGYDNGQFHNQKVFKVWPTDYETKQPNPALTVIQAAAASGDTVQVGFTSKQVTYNNKTFPENTIHEVVVVGSAPQNPSQPATEASGWAAPVPTTSPVAPQTGAAPSTPSPSMLSAIANTLRGMADELEGK